MQIALTTAAGRRLTALALAMSFSVTPALMSAPADELLLAVAAGGSTSAREAQADQFLRAFTAVIVGVKERQIGSRVSTAVKLRPDLADKIVVAALTARRVDRNPLNHRLSCDIISGIIRAAVLAAPPAAVAIVRAAIVAEPYARECIITAAVSAAPELESSIRQGVSEGIPLPSVASPGNINPTDSLPQEPVNSPEQPPAIL